MPNSWLIWFTQVRRGAPTTLWHILHIYEKRFVGSKIMLIDAERQGGPLWK